MQLVPNALASLDGQREHLNQLAIRDLTVRVEQLEQARKGLVYSPNIARGEAAPASGGIEQLKPALMRPENVYPSEFMHDLAEVVGDKAIVLAHRARPDLGYLPARQVKVESVYQCFHLQKARQWLEQVIVLFVGQVALYIKVTHEHNGPKGQDLLLAAAELGVLHIALHDADHRLGVGEVRVCDFIKDDGVARPYQTNLPGVEIDEQAGWRRLAAGEHVCVVGKVAVQVGLACLARPKLY